MEKSVSANPGPRSALRARLPNPLEGSWKMHPAVAVVQVAGLNHCTVVALGRVRPYCTGASRLGCRTFAVQVNVEVVVTFRGLPVCHCEMPESCQPSTRRLRLNGKA